jgi:hypothetical protein
MQEGIEEGQTGQASTLPMAQGAKASSMDNTTLFFSLLGTANTIHDFPGLVRQPIQALQAYQSGTLPSKMVMFKKTTKWAVGATLAVYTLSQTPKIAAWIQEEYFKDSKKGEP